jgi:iron(III) transport system permease protein
MPQSPLGFRLAVLLGVLPLLVFSAIPVFFLVRGAFTTSWGAGEFTLSHLFGVFSDPTFFGVLVNTLIFGGGSALISVAMGTIYAWIVVRLDCPGKRLLEVLAVMSLTMPMVIKGMGWIFLLSPRIGLLNLASLRLFDFPLFNVYSLPGMIFVAGVGGLPLTFLTISPAMNAMDPSLEESARVMGSGIPTILRKVTLQVLRPAILSAFLLMFIVGVENFDYPYIVGLPAGIETLATRVVDLLRYETPTWELASAYSLVYLALTITLVSIYIWSTRKAYRFVLVTGKPSQRSLMKVGTKGRIVALLLSLSFLMMSFGLPFSSILLTSILPYFTIRAQQLVIPGFTLQNYADAINLTLFPRAVMNSFAVSTAVAITVTLLSALIAYATLRMRSRGTRFFEYLSMMPLAFPTVVYALGLLWALLVTPVLSDLIYGTNWALVLGMLIAWLPFSTRIIAGNLIQISGELEDASHTLGASWSRTIRRIILPLLKIGLANSLLYVFINSFRTLGSVVLLVTPQSYVFISLIADMFEVTAASYPIVAALSVIMTLMLLAVSLVLRVVFKASLIHS